MIKITRRYEISLIVFVAVSILGCAVIGCKYFPESTFELASESRLPKWFTLPRGLGRGDVSVTMNYYVKPWGRTATFILHDTKGHTLAEINGKLRGTGPLHLNGSPQSGATSYPSFEVVTANGVTEIVEHEKMEPIFYMADNPTVWEKLIGVRPRQVARSSAPNKYENCCPTAGMNGPPRQYVSEKDSGSLARSGAAK